MVPRDAAGFARHLKIEMDETGYNLDKWDPRWDQKWDKNLKVDVEALASELALKKSSLIFLISDFTFVNKEDKNNIF